MTDDNLAEFILGITNTPEEIETYKMCYELRQRGFGKKEFELILSKDLELLLDLSKTGFLRTVEEKINDQGFQALLEEHLNNIDISMASRDNNKILTHMWGHFLEQCYGKHSTINAPRHFMEGFIIHLLSNLYSRSLQKNIPFTIKRNSIKSIVLNILHPGAQCQSLERNFSNAWSSLVDKDVLRKLTNIKQNMVADQNDYDIDPIKLYDYVDSIDRQSFVSYVGKNDRTYEFSLYSLLVDSPVYKQERARRLQEMFETEGKSNLNFNYPIELQEDTSAEKSAKEIIQVIYPDKKD